MDRMRSAARVPGGERMITLRALAMAGDGDADCDMIVSVGQPLCPESLKPV